MNMFHVVCFAIAKACSFQHLCDDEDDDEMLKLLM